WRSSSRWFSRFDSHEGSSVTFRAASKAGVADKLRPYIGSSVTASLRFIAPSIFMLRPYMGSPVTACRIFGRRLFFPLRPYKGSPVARRTPGGTRHTCMRFDPTRVRLCLVERRDALGIPGCASTLQGFDCNLEPDVLVLTENGASTL